MLHCALGRREKIDRARAELLASAEPVQAELAAHPGHARAELLADLFARLLGTKTPPGLSSRRRSLFEDVARSRAEGVAYIASGIWRRLIQLESLEPTSADPLAEVLGELVESPVVLHYLEYEARGLALRAAADRLRAALDRRFPGFRAGSDHALVDRAVLSQAGLDLSRLVVDYHASGHLRRLARRRPESGSPVLELEAEPGRGRYGETGRRGGYGFIVDERYEDGHAIGVLCSPWHDGEEYRTSKPWLVWVLECAGEIARGR